MLNLNLPAAFHQCRNLNRQLQNAADNNTNGQRSRHIPEKSTQKRECNHGEVQEHRSECRRAKPMKAVENPHRHRGQADQEDIGEHDPVQSRRQFQLSRRRAKTGGKESNDLRRKEDACNRNHGQQNRDDRQHRVGELPALLLLPFCDIAGENGNESRADGALAHKAAEEIGNPVRGGVRVRSSSRAEQKAMRESRIYPNVRLTMVRALMSEADFRRCRCSLISRDKCTITATRHKEDCSCD